MRISIISFTQKGAQLSERLVQKLNDSRFDTDVYTKCSRYRSVKYVDTSVGKWAEEQMKAKNAMLFIGACGIAVRAAAPYLTDKLHDSPVLVMDECARYVIPVLSGHMGGANELAGFIAGRTGAVPVITTSTDINEKFAVDLFAKRNHLYINDKDKIVKISAKVLAEESISVSVEPRFEYIYRILQKENISLNRMPYPPEDDVDILIASYKNILIKSCSRTLLLVPQEYVIGIGCKRGKSAEEIEAFIMQKTKELGIKTTQICAAASISQKSSEQGIIQWCQKEGIKFLTYTAEELRNVQGSFHKSAFVAEKVGVDNVCERAALKACGEGGRLVLEKCAGSGMTIAVAKRRSMCKVIYIVGMGAGREDMMTGEALRAIEQADVIVGYTVYLNLLSERFRNKELISTPMRQEKERCEICFKEAEKGKRVALICSGDAGIYGMASLMYEIGQDYPDTELEVVAGITAASSGAAVLGAPINHDFCVISLSDLLTPWEKIEKRLKAAAQGDFAIVLYNPSSHKRRDYLQRACDILLNIIEKNRVCGYVENIGRDGTMAQTCTLMELRNKEVNMFTTVFIGNSQSEIINGKLVTKRGYCIERNSSGENEKKDTDICRNN